MRELIERLRGSLYACNAIRGYLDDAGFPDGGDAHGQLAEIETALTDAAAALEAAREDACRLDWLADRDNPIGNVQLPSVCVMNNMHSLRAAIDEAMRLDPELDAAIDQARGKGVQGA